MRWVIVAALLISNAVALGEADGVKARVGIFPLAGDGPAELRERCAFSLRVKLDRSGTYDVIDGVKMQEIAAEAEAPLGFDTNADAIRRLNELLSADVLIWGEITASGGASQLRVKILDLRQAELKPLEIRKDIARPTDLRFVTEQVLELLPQIQPFAHPSEQAVSNDPRAEELWRNSPNLLANGDFSRPGKWQAIYMAQQYEPTLSDCEPEPDRVVIYALRAAGGGSANPVLAMRLSRQCAENNGLACLSDSIEISKNTRYRLSFRYKSDGPRLHVFVKGYTMALNPRGEKVEREIYRRQVPPTEATDGQWVTVVDELNPQHVSLPVQFLRVDLYAYLHSGLVMFDDVVLKAVGEPTRRAADEALDRPTTRAAQQTGR